MGSFITPVVAVEDGAKVWHLVKHDDGQQANRTQKAISEIFLTRLLSTKVIYFVCLMMKYVGCWTVCMVNTRVNISE